MTWRDLRHTANTLAADAGANQATLQARMGHADPKVSAIYLHTSKSHDRQLADHLTAMTAEPTTSCPPDTQLPVVALHLSEPGVAGSPF